MLLDYLGGAVDAPAAASADAQMARKILHRSKPAREACLDLSFGDSVAQADVHEPPKPLTREDGNDYRLRIILMQALS
jgi:hypothetical protein